jgi:hypothetical protein
LKWTTGASSSYAEIYNAFEAQDVNALGGKTITVSVKVRAQASFASTFRLRLQTNTTANTQTGGAWTTVVTTDETPSTSAFTTVSATYTVPVGTKGLRIALQPAAAQASGTGLYLGQAQLEVGSVATAYKYAGGTLQGELAACQRYFERFANDGGATGSALAIGFTDTTTTGLFPLPFTEKRVTPTFTFSAASGFQVNTAAATAISSGRPSKKFVRIDTTGSGYTANVPANLRFVDSSTATIDISAEL